MNPLSLTPIIDVQTENHLVVQNVPTTYEFRQLLKGSSNAVIKPYGQSPDSLYVTFGRGQLEFVVWTIQNALEKLGLSHTTSGQCAPTPFQWDGYDALDPQVVIGVKQRTKAIASEYAALQSTVKIANDIAWRIGKMLFEQRQALEHGKFKEWYEAEFPKSPDTLYRFIGLYEAYPQEIPPTIKDNASLSVLYEVTRKETPEAARQEVEARVAQGETLTKKQTQKIIANHKQPLASTTELAEGEAPTGVEGYVYINGGQSVLHKPTGKILTLGEFAALTRKKKSPSSRKKSGGGSGGGGKRSAADIAGDALATGMTAQIERAQARTQREHFMNELRKLPDDILEILAAKIAKIREDFKETRNPLAYVTDFIQE